MPISSVFQVVSEDPEQIESIVTTLNGYVTTTAASEAAAATSETNAAASETNAALSAAAALVSKTQAASSAASASSDEAAAAASATASQTAATSSSANAASTSADAAQTAADRIQTGLDVVAAAGSATAASNSQIAAASSAAAAAATLDTFDDRYLGSFPSDPLLDNDGDALVTGSLYFSNTANEMRVYDGGSWIAASSAGGASLINYNYTATAAQTAFSGSDDNSNTLSYTVGNLIVTRNGVVLEDGTDYTATDGATITLSVGATAGDEINIVAFKSFTTADMVSATSGGTFQSNVTVNGTMAATAFSGDGSALTGITIPTLSSLGIANHDQVTVTAGGAVTATSFSGDGSNLTGIPTPTLTSLGIPNHDQVTVDGSGNLDVTGTTTLRGGGTGYVHVNVEDSSLCPTMTFTRNGGGTTTNGFMKFENSGGQVAEINATGGGYFLGNVGIGTSSTLGSKMFVAQGAAASPATSGNMTTGAIIGSSIYGEALNVGTDASGAWYNAAYANNAGVARIHRWLTGGTERMRINTSGNVGIGTASPTAQLDVSGVSRYTFNVGNAYTLQTSINASITAFVDAYKNAAQHIWQTSGTERMRIDSNGNVGIGTTNPIGKLDVQDNTGSLSATKDVTSEFHRFDGTYSPRLQIRHSTDGTDINHTYSTGASNLTFSIASSERLRIDSSGRVTMPSQPFALVDFGGNSAYNALSGTAPFDNIVQSQGNHYNTSTYKFTCPVAGLYEVSTKLLTSSNSDYGSVELHVNGTRTFRSYTVYRGLHGHFLINCAANDVLHLEIPSHSYYTGTDDQRYSWVSYRLVN